MKLELKKSKGSESPLDGHMTNFRLVVNCTGVFRQKIVQKGLELVILPLGGKVVVWVVKHFLGLPDFVN